MYTITQLEDAIISALEALKTSHGVRAVKTYGSELDEGDIKKTAAQVPAVYLVYGGSDYAAHGGRKVEQPRFHVLVLDKSLRAEEEARRGGAQNPGVYALLNAVRDVLCGKQLGLEIGPFELIGEEPVFIGDGLALYGAQYKTWQAHLYAG